MTHPQLSKLCSDASHLLGPCVFAHDLHVAHIPLKSAEGRSCFCRGVATFPDGVPEAPGMLRMIWSERGVRVGISTISDTECFWFTMLACPEEAKMETPEKRKADALASVAGFCAHIQEAIRHTPAECISRSRIVDRWMRADRSVGQGCITVMGDALHPMTPSLGQGGCIALEVSTLIPELIASVCRSEGSTKVYLT